jgi:hypothetical protein
VLEGHALMDAVGSEQVLIQVVDVRQGREITWRGTVAEKLGDRLADIRGAIASGAQAVAESLAGLPRAEGWRLGEVSASFGVTLTAEAGVVLSKASTQATFEVTITYQHVDEQ